MTSQVISIKRYKRRKAAGNVKGVGLCALFSRPGDWAFDYALALARAHQCRLNVFYFLQSPYKLRRDVVFVDAAHTQTAPVTPELIAQKDRELREQFDDRLGDYTDVGFRLCEGADEWELRKCFRRGQYDVLVIGYEKRGANFGGTNTIEGFALSFKGPVVMVGPDAPDSFYLNQPAEDWLEHLMIPQGHWKAIDPSAVP